MTPPVYSEAVYSAQFLSGGVSDLPVDAGFRWIIVDVTAVFANCTIDSTSMKLTGDGAVFVQFIAPPFGGRAFHWHGRQAVDNGLQIAVESPSGDFVTTCDIRITVYKLALP